MNKKKLVPNKTKISFYIPDELLERINNLAKMGGITRTKLIVNMLEETTKTLEFTGKIGVLQVSLLLRDLSENMWSWARKIKEKKISLQ